jgi:hypothetical protein
VSEDDSIHQKKNKSSDLCKELGVHCTTLVLSVGEFPWKEMFKDSYLPLRCTADMKLKQGRQQQMMDLVISMLISHRDVSRDFLISISCFLLLFSPRLSLPLTFLPFLLLSDSAANKTFLFVAVCNSE